MQPSRSHGFRVKILICTHTHICAFVPQVYGKGAQLILPVPAFVVKTQNTADGQKVFINVCTSEKASVEVREAKAGAQEGIVAGTGTELQRAGRSNRQGQDAGGGIERAESWAH